MGRSTSAGGRRRGAGLVTAAAVFLVGALCTSVMPAEAAPWWWPVTTTTRAPATTTTTTTTGGAVNLNATGCGAVVVKPDGTPWRCTLAENFLGTSLNRNLWAVQTSLASGFGSQDDCYLDSPNNVSVGGGTLKLTVRRLAAPITCRTPTTTYATRYTSGTIATYQRWSQTYGRFEFRAKFPSATAKGLHGALWLWPDNAAKYGAFPLSGEIDVAEVFSLYNDRAIPYVHYWPARTSQTNNYCMLKVTDWHTYVLEWTTTNITISFDGKVCVDEVISPAAPLAAPQPFDHPFMLVLTEGLGVGTNRLDATKAPAFPATLEVDYVRAWS